MRLSFGQEMRQVQKQILAPRMIQSMEILQLPIQALEERIEQELQENPVLEMAEVDPDLPEEEIVREEADAKTTEEKELVVDEAKNNADDFERLETLGEEWTDAAYDERPRLSSNRLQEDEERRHDAIANMEAKPQTLSDYLVEQLGWYELDEPTRQMAERIIYNLDPNGRPDRFIVRRGRTGSGAEGAAGRSAARSAGRGCPQSARVFAVATVAGHGPVRADAHADHQPLGRPGA